MDAVEFLKNHYRMCTSSSECDECKAFKCCSFGSLKPSNPEELVKVVEEWAKEHPVKTRQSEFLKDFPNALKYDDGSLLICPKNVDASLICRGTSCKICSNKYWSQEIE